MPVNKLNPEQTDWAKAVYHSLHWNYPDEGDGGSEAQTANPQFDHTNTSNGHNGTTDPRANGHNAPQPPQWQRPAGAKPSPIHTVFEEIGLPETEEFHDRIEAYHDKREAFKQDPLQAAYADPEAAAWEHRVKDVLGRPQEEADETVQLQFRNNLKVESRNITREIFESQADDPRFVQFLQNAANSNPKDLADSHREMLVFMSKNLKTLGNTLVKNVNELYHQHAFGKAMTDTVENAKENAVSPGELKKLEELEQEVIEYRMAVARQLGMALNTTNNVQSALSFGSTIDTAVDELSYENTRAVNAATGLAKMTQNMVSKHLAKSNSPAKTMKWVGTQPWAKLVDVDIQSNGRYFNIVTELRKSQEAGGDTDGQQIDAETDLAQRDLTKEKLTYNPELIFYGLRSPEMLAALTAKPTGEATQDDVPFVEKPSDLAMTWGETLANAQARGRDISDQLPDYMTLKQVRYHDIQKGFFSDTDTIRTAWVVEQKPASDTLAEVNLINNLPRSIAGDLGELALNMSDLKKDQTAKNDQILEKKNHLDDFLNTKGDGLLKSFGTAHDALSSLQDHAMGEVQAKIRNGTSIQKILKWVKEQPWSAMFKVEITPMEGGKKGEYSISVQGADQTNPETRSAVMNEPAPQDNENAANISDEGDQDFGAGLHGLSGALRALLNPSVYKQLISKPTGENSDGMPVVEEPTKLARDWAGLIQKSVGSDASLPDYLELRQVKYRIRSFLPWKRNKLEACWVLEFKPSAFRKTE